MGGGVWAVEAGGGGLSRLLLDTCILIAIERADPLALRFLRIVQQAGYEIATCAIVVAEYYSGAKRGAHPDVDDLLAAAAHLPASFESAVQAGDERRRLRTAGIQLSLPDALIAAVVREYRPILVTQNVRDFPQTDITVRTLQSFLALTR